MSEFRTAQNVQLRYDVATVWERVFAKIIDVLILVGVWGAAMGIAYTIFDNPFGESSSIMGVLFIFLLIPTFMYDFLMEWFFGGQSLGKMVMKIKVVNVDGSAASVGAFLIRWLFAMIVDNGFIAFIIVLAGEKGQRLGDIVAKTMVITLKAPRPISSETLLKKIKTDYVLTYPEVGNLSDNEIQLIKDVLSRAEKYGDTYTVKELSVKIKTKLFITSQLDDFSFLHLVLKDYANYDFVE